MKTTKKLILLIFSFTIVYSCSKDNEDSETVKNSELVKYLSTPNSNNQLVSEAFITEDDATTFVYGNTDSNGELSQITGLAFEETNSNTVYYFLLDELSRVKEIYSETNGIKDKEVQLFNYPEEGLVNYIAKERNWINGLETITYFTTVEIDGENYIPYNLIGKSSKTKGILWDKIVLNIKVVIAVAAVVGTLIVVAKGVGVLAAVGAAIIFTASAFADVPPVPNVTPSQPQAPITVENICDNSTLKVFKVGVDPGNVLTAFVNGGVGSYKFYWSTGATGTGAAAHTITAPNSEIHYVLVVDENGCSAFGSSKPKGLINEIRILNDNEILDFSNISGFIESYPNTDNTFDRVVVLNDNDIRIINIYLKGAFINNDGIYNLTKNSFNEDENFTVQFLHNNYSLTKGFVVLNSGTLIIANNITKFDFEGSGYILENPNVLVSFVGNVTIN